MMLDWLGDDFPRFPEFVRMLREYERQPVAAALPALPPIAAPEDSHDLEGGYYTPCGWHPADAAFRAYLAGRRQTTP